MGSRLKRQCAHQSLCINSSQHANEAGFVRIAGEKLLAATTPSGRKLASTVLSTPEEIMTDDWTFPAPLVLPEDELSWDAKYPGQSMRSWLSLNKETPVDSRRKTIYVIPPPKMTKEAQPLMNGWETPNVPEDTADSRVPDQIEDPKVDDVCDYLRAFYHKMDVKKHSPFRWQPWKSSSASDSKAIMGLVSPSPTEEMIGVRYRRSLDGVSTQQLNLSDILDAMIDRVPRDAYAIIMLVDQDLYEDEEDDFCCGRAFGGSRIAVVSSFRYHPSLDNYADIDYGHMWPASHCQRYTDGLCSTIKRPAKRAKSSELRNASAADTSPMVAAVKAAKSTLRPRTSEDWAGLWFSRVARTVAHELGHCLRFDHCVYYACVMQGTASVTEDVRQPPYLCAVCLAKLSYAMALHVGSRGSTVDLQRRYIKERYEAIREYCGKWEHIGMFSGWNAWVSGRLDQIGGDSKVEVVVREAPKRRTAADFALLLNSDDD